MDLSWRRILYILAGTVIITELGYFLVTLKQESELQTRKRNHMFKSRNSMIHSDIEKYNQSLGDKRNELKECKKKKYTCGQGLKSTNGKCEIRFEGEYENRANACLDRDSISHQKNLDLFKYVEEKGHLPSLIRSGHRYAYCTPDLRQEWKKTN